MKKIKFRQPVFIKGKFDSFHYWGDIKGGFVSPIDGNLKRDSQQYINRKDKSGKEIYDGETLKVCWTNSGGNKRHESSTVLYRIREIQKIHQKAGFSHHGP